MMQYLDNAVEIWFDWIVATSWQVALLVVIVGLISLFLWRCSPRLQYGLWLLVLLKIFLPPSIAAPWSLRSWVFEPLRAKLPVVAASAETSAAGALLHDMAAAANNLAGAYSMISLTQVLFLVWSIGVIIFAITVVGRYLRIASKFRNEPAILEGPFRVAFESIAIRLKLQKVPELHSSDLIKSPLLLGVFNPRIMIPNSLVGKMSADQIQSVLTHELVHWRRMDSWIGWIQSFGQMLFWFHPLVWWASNQLRHQREFACDEISMLDGGCDPQTYGDTIVQVLTLTRGCSAMSGGLIGVFGNGSNLQNRLEKIMNYDMKRSNFGWASRLAILAAALVLLPMSAISGQNDGNDDSSSETPYPQIVETVPAPGATDVDPKLDSIIVKFDRDMSEGMSWTGGKPYMPTHDKSRKIGWTDKRTCVMPVKVQKGKLYRVGVNAKDFQNFKSTNGTAVPPYVFAFTTVGATKGMQSKVQTPKIVKFAPALAAADVSPTTKMLKVTFNVAMGEGMSWTGGGENFPAIPAGKAPKWSRDKKSCMMPVELKPNWTYQIGLNSLSYNNFQSQIGIPLEPVLYEFSTADE